MSTRCPLYQEAIVGNPWRNADTAHTGLLFDKFADAWAADDWSFDKNAFLRRLTDKRNNSICSPALLTEACARQYELAEFHGGIVRRFTNDSRFITGLGRSHPLENGFAFHPTLGTPFLPGSGVKGVLRAWLRESRGEWDPEARRRTGAWREDASDRDLFGTQAAIGHAVFLDLLPVGPPALVTEVMTPHYGPYYQDQETPGDWHSPVPIPFLAVEAGQEWQAAILPTNGGEEIDRQQLGQLADDLADALDWLGAGAKTAVGYGRFTRDDASEKRLRQAAERRRAEQEASRREEAERQAFEASLKNDSEPLQRLKRLQREQRWERSAGDQNMVAALNTFANEHTQPPSDCLAWIRDLLEGIPNYQGVWSDPDAMRGKAKKPKYKAPTIRDLVKRLNPDLGG